MTIGSSADQSGISISEETEWGVINTSPEFHRLLPVGDGLKFELSKGRTKGIRPEAVTSDVFVTKGGTNGDINLEMFYGTPFDILFRHACRGDFDVYGILKNGVDYKSVTIEKTLSVDSSTLYKRYTGMRLNSLAVDLNTESEDAITLTANFMGETEEVGEEAIAGATYNPIIGNNPMYMPEVRSLTVSGSGLSSPLVFKTFGFTISNECREQQGKSTQTVAFPDISAQGIAYGTRQITISLEAYFKDHSFRNIFVDNTSFSLSYIISNGTSGYKITFPACKVMEEETPNEGTGSDIMDKMSLEAIYDPDTECVIQIEKIPSLAAGSGLKLTGTSPSPDFQGTFYKDGTSYDGEDVYASVDGSNAIWWSTSDAAWTVTEYGDIGTFPTVSGWENTNASPTGTWTAIGTATGTLTGTSYDPQA